MNARTLDSSAHEPRYPDFIIAGAMKSGTTAIHSILNQHPQVFIPDQEVFFFDIDDFQQHPDFALRSSGKWEFPTYAPTEDRLSTWYSAFFEDARPNQVVGEDSTTYFASKKAPERIRAFLPQAKLIVMLRDPVARAYSNYWHLVRTRRALFDFETTLQRQPHSLIERSCYKTAADRFLDTFERGSIKFVIFEEFVSKPQEVINDLFDFLGLDSSLAIDTLDYARNSARVPRSLRLQLIANWVSSLTPDTRYAQHLPQPATYQTNGNRNVLTRAANRGAALLNRAAMAFAKAEYPAMNPQTQAFLKDLFRRENEGLGQLLGKELEDYWPWMVSKAY